MERCYCENHKSYSYYGKKGITVCERWHISKNFIEDMYSTYENGLTLDRKDNKGNYDLSNCRWVTKSVQTRNTIRIRKNNTSGYRGVTYLKANNKWLSQIKINSKNIYLGSFDTSKKAGEAYDYYVINNKLEHTTNGLICSQES